MYYTDFMTLTNYYDYVSKLFFSVVKLIIKVRISVTLIKNNNNNNSNSLANQF